MLPARRFLTDAITNLVSKYVGIARTGEGVEQTEPFAFGEESLDVGHEAGSAVTTDYPAVTAPSFQERSGGWNSTPVSRATITPTLITPEERLQVAMAKQ